MSHAIDTVEELARRYKLTPQLVTAAAQVFDAHAVEGAPQPCTSLNSSPNAIMTAQGLQQLLIKLGTPLSLQEVTELLCFFGKTAAVPREGEASHIDTSGENGAAVKGSSAVTVSVLSESPSLRQGQKRSLATGPKHTNVEDAPSPSPTAVECAEKSEEVVTALSPSTPTATLPRQAVNADGINFNAFLYFLVLYPELALRTPAAPRTATDAPSTGIPAASTSGHVDISALFASIDADSDGVWSAQDIRHAAERCLNEEDGFLQNDPDLLRLANMHPAELAVALHELDVDNDGVVTVEDVREALFY